MGCGRSRMRLHLVVTVKIVFPRGAVNILCWSLVFCCFLLCFFFKCYEYSLHSIPMFMAIKEVLAHLV